MVRRAWKALQCLDRMELLGMEKKQITLDGWYVWTDQPRFVCKLLIAFLKRSQFFIAEAKTFKIQTIHWQNSEYSVVWDGRKSLEIKILN